MAWGDLEGDQDADGIIAQRRNGLKRLRWAILQNVIIVISSAIWYSLTENPIALAIEIIGAAWLVGSGVQHALYRQFTMLMIAERRIHICEQRMDALTDKVASLETPPRRPIY